MRQYYLFLTISVLFNLNLFAQGSISGHISVNGEPIPFANIGIKGSKLGTSTNESGFYFIKNVPHGTYQLMVSVLGYETQTKRISLDSTTPNVRLDFLLLESATQLEDVVISGTMKEMSKTESPVPVEVYSPQFFRANPTPSIFESLQNVNGVKPQLNCNVCNTGDIHINGLEGPYTMILIDGMPIVSGLSTVYGLTGIPQSLIARTEIVKGPASTLYGSEAVGGLVNVITKDPVEAPIVAAEIMTTSWAEINTDIGIKWNIAPKIHSLTGINHFKYGNPIDNNKDGFTDITLQDRISVFNKLSFNRKEDRQFSIAGRYVYEDRWGGQLNWTPDFRGGDSIYAESIYTNRWETFGIYQLPFKEQIDFRFSANGHHQNSVYGTTIYNAHQYVGFAQLSWAPQIGNLNDILIGIPYRYIYYDDNTPATQTGDNINTLNFPSITHLPGVFIQDELQLSETQKILLGIRYDYNSLHGTIFTPRINYKLNSRDKKNIFRISAGNGYRVANVFTEDHAALTGARTVEFEEDLKPEKSYNANLNYVKKIYTKNATYIGLDLSTWYTYFTNRIIPDYETDVNKIIYSNLNGFAVSKGVSLNLDLSWTNGLKILAGATAMNVSIEENGIRKQQLLTEQYTTVWNISYAFKKGITIDYTGNLYGPMHLPVLGTLDNRPTESPWFSIQNIQISKKFGKHWEIYGGVKNLLNYTPPANSIARSFDPFDKQVTFDNNGQVIATANNPNALTFDPSYVFAPNQGIRGFIGLRYTVQ